MDKRTTAAADARPAADALASLCAGCTSDISVHLARRIVEGPADTRGAITYADADIVVWDCPSCGFANADVLGE